MRFENTGSERLFQQRYRDSEKEPNRYPEMKDSINQIKISMESLTSRLDQLV